MCKNKLIHIRIKIIIFMNPKSITWFIYLNDPGYLYKTDYIF